MNKLAENREDYQAIDLDKALAVLTKNLVWIILIFGSTLTTAYLVIRWTKPLFESTSELKLDVDTNATELGLTNFTDNTNLNVISGEIELIQSKLFFNKIIDNFDLGIAYFTEGNVLNDEKYMSSPFKVDYILKDPAIYDQKIHIELIDRQRFKVNFNSEDMSGASEYGVGELVTHPLLNFSLQLTDYYREGADTRFFFILNSRASLISYFEQNLVVEPLNLNANTIKIALRDFNRYKARDLVNTIDSLYLQYSQEEKNRENKQKIEWLNGELGQIEDQLEQYENYFENFTIENRTNDLDEDLKNIIIIINELDSQQLGLNDKIQNIDLFLSALDTQEFTEASYDQFPKFIRDNIEALNELMLERDRLRLSYTETTFALTKKEKEIERLISALSNNLSELRQRYRDNIAEITKRKNILQNDFEKLPGKNTEFNKKKRFFELYEEFYLSLMQSKAEFQIAEAGTTTQFKILSPATLPTAPIKPKKVIIMGIGFVGGLILSFIFLSFRYLLHNKITTFQELEKNVSTPILGAVTKTSDKMEVTSLIIDKRPKSAVSEALRSVRTNIEFMLNKDKQRVISVTSTISGEGKTFIAVNLGGIIALSKKKVVVVDLDMRKPRVHLSFNNGNGAINDKGVSTILINKHTIDECISKTRIDNLHYIPAGPTPPNPSELMLNPEFDDLISNLQKIYDLVILDTPPAGLVTDGILAMKKADLAIYIVRANYSRKAFLKTLERLVRVNQFKNISVILNAVPKTSGNGYGYGYYDEKSLAVKKQV